MKLFYPILFILIFLSGCGRHAEQTQEAEITTCPDDFYFEMEFGSPHSKLTTDYFNSKDSTFKRRGILIGDSVTRDTVIRIVLNKQDLQIIYSSFLQNDFLKLPSSANQNTILDGGIEYTGITFFANGKLKPVCSWNCKKLDSTKEMKRFENVKKSILEVLNSRQNYRSLKPSNLVGM